MNLGTRIGIEARGFNSWGANTLQTELDDYLDNTRKESSVAYLHVVLTIFAVEALTDPGNVENMHYGWLVGDYSMGISGYDTPEYKSKMWNIFESYKATLRILIGNHTTIETDKAYTADFETSDLLIVREVSLDTVTDSIFEIV